MKRIFPLATALALSSLLFTQCKKEDQNKIFDFNFYTSQPAIKMFLFVDDVPKGVLPYLATEPSCGTVSTDGMAPLQMQLRSGSYRIVGKDSLGRVLSSDVFRISANSMGSSGSIGGLMSNQKDNWVSVGLFY